MVSFIQAIILSIIQGITEWFPISSSGHLAIAHEIFGFQNLGFDVYLHFASVFSVIFLFRKDIARLLVFDKEANDYIIKLLIAIIPAAVIGFYLREHVRTAFSNLLFIGIFFIIFGVFVYSTKFTKEIKNKPDKLDSLIIGISQVFSLFPGISRAGMTMGSALISGIKKESAVKFSFLLAIPIILGASLLEVKEIVYSDINFLVLLTSFTLTFFISLITIKYLIQIIKKEKFYLFGIYNIILGIIVLLWYFSR